MGNLMMTDEIYSLKDCRTAERYLNPKSTAHYNVAEHQFTIHPPYNDTSLNEMGKMVLKLTLCKVEANVFDDELRQASLIPSPSGHFFHRSDHPGKNDEVLSFSLQGVLCSWHNRQARGIRVSKGDVVNTSYVIMYQEPLPGQPGWAKTFSGKLYKLTLEP